MSHRNIGLRKNGGNEVRESIGEVLAPIEASHPNLTVHVASAGAVAFGIAGLTELLWTIQLDALIVAILKRTK